MYRIEVCTNEARNSWAFTAYRFNTRAEALAALKLLSSMSPTTRFRLAD